jgi:hypothetical protein
MPKHMLAVPVVIAVLAGSAVGVAAQDEAGPDGLVTEEVEPGVERIIRDDAGHDLDETHPTYRYDMDRVTIADDAPCCCRAPTTAPTTRPTPRARSYGRSGSLGRSVCLTVSSTISCGPEPRR